MEPFVCNIRGIHCLMEILSSFPNHRFVNVGEYGKALISDFYFGNFCFLSSYISADKYCYVLEIINNFYQGLHFQLYVTEDNLSFLQFYSKGNNNIVTEPGMHIFTSDIPPINELSEGLIITKAKHSDIDDLLSLMRKSKPNLDLVNNRIYLELTITNNKITFWIARLNSTPVGMRMIIKVNDFEVQGNCNFVDPEYRRYGIASQMMKVALSSLDNNIKIFTNQTTPDGYKFCSKFGLKKHCNFYYYESKN